MKFAAAFLSMLVTAFSGAALADVEAGKTAYASRGCIGCHGAGGISVVTAYPSLKGKSAEYIRSNLTEYRSGARENAVMNAMAAGLSDEDIENLADYIGSL